jgi:hypothetical protein
MVGGSFCIAGFFGTFWLVRRGLLAGLFYPAVVAEHLAPPVVEKPAAFSAGS